ncbi:MAG: hypothetical protein FVQ80_04935 [Planctomycetes bacterium]|nr:hypothetical protein [Planctomycetota bacterium]
MAYLSAINILQETIKSGIILGHAMMLLGQNLEFQPGGYDLYNVAARHAYHNSEYEKRQCICLELVG